MTSTTTTNPSSLLSDDELTKQLQQLRSQLNKKQTFESAISSLKTLLIQSYRNSSPTIRNLFYDVVCRVATVLRTRYTFPGYLIAGVELLEIAESLAESGAERSHLKSCILSLRQTIDDINGVDGNNSNNNYGGGYLFEGHLTVDQEPPQPNWLVQQNLITALASQSQNNENINGGSENENMTNLMRSLVESMDVSMMDNLEDFLPLMEGGAGGSRAAPPASKEVVEKLPVIKVENEEMLKNKFGEEGGECCICKEKLRVGDEMQEMPCKHVFHPPCLKPWLDEHNSCPICRHELPTDDHKYESWKEREKELEEERRGAANAVRGGEFMYI